VASPVDSHNALDVVGFRIDRPGQIPGIVRGAPVGNHDQRLPIQIIALQSRNDDFNDMGNGVAAVVGRYADYDIGGSKLFDLRSDMRP